MSSSSLHDYMGKDYKTYYDSLNDTRPHPNKLSNEKVFDLKVEPVEDKTLPPVDCEAIANVPKERFNPVSTWSKQSTLGCCIA